MSHICSSLGHGIEPLSLVTAVIASAPPLHRLVQHPPVPPRRRERKARLRRRILPESVDPLAGRRTVAAMTPQEIARRLVELCRRGDYETAHKELFSDDAATIEPEGSPDRIQRGQAALAAKLKMFQETFQVHGGSVTDPVIGGDFFSCGMMVDVTEKKSGARFKIDEICVYEVRDGKIVSQQFFYRQG